MQSIVEGHGINHAAYLDNRVIYCKEIRNADVTYDVITYNDIEYKFDNIFGIFKCNQRLFVANHKTSTNIIEIVSHDNQSIAEFPNERSISLIALSDSSYVVITYGVIGRMFLIDKNGKTQLCTDGIQLSFVTGAVLLPNGCIAITQGFPSSCVKIINTTQPEMYVQIIGRQANITCDGPSHVCTFTDLVHCDIDNSGVIFMLDNDHKNMISRIRIMLQDFSVHTLHLQDFPLLSTITVAINAVLATAADGCSILSFPSDFINGGDERNVLPEIPLAIRDLPVRIINGDGTNITTIHKSVLARESAVINMRLKYNEPMDVFLLQATTMTAIALVDILYFPQMVRLHATSVIFETYLLADYYQMHSVSRACRYDLLKRLHNGELQLMISLMQNAGIDKLYLPALISLQKTVDLFIIKNDEIFIK